MSDIEIARKAKMKPISEILKSLDVPDTPEAFSPMGRHIAKINLEYIESLNKIKMVNLSSLSILNTSRRR